MPMRLPTHAERERAKRERLRPSAGERGYDRTWRRFRLWYLRRHPLCETCKTAGATEVHHRRRLRDYPAGRLNPEAVQALCKSCHSRETAGEVFG